MQKQLGDKEKKTKNVKRIKEVDNTEKKNNKDVVKTTQNKFKNTNSDNILNKSKENPSNKDNIGKNSNNSERFSNTMGDVDTEKMVKAKKITSSKSTRENKKNVKTSVNEIEKNNIVDEIKKSEIVEKQKKEQNIIEKIKNFLSKIAEMQDESKKEKVEDKLDLDREKNNKDEEKNSNSNYLLEYYDLPYRYNETVVKILAQTPKRLFVYWDVSDKDKQRYLNAFGEDFFEKTYPVLLLYNEDKNYVTEVTINDFANSWYIDIHDPKTKYIIQLGRKFREIPTNIRNEKLIKENIILHTDYLPMADSNKLEVPNDHILFEKIGSSVTFRNVKNNQETVKEFREFKNEYGKTYNYSMEEFYKEMYKEEIDEGIFDMSNPTSGVNSSSFK